MADETTNLTEKVIKNKAFRYYVEQPSILDPEKTILRERVARRGDTVQLRDADVKIGEAMGAFLTDEDFMDDEAVLPGDPADKTVEQFVEWLETDRPSIPAVLKVVDDNAETADKVLEAEQLVTGRDPRPTLVAKLEAIIEEATEGDDEDDEKGEGN